MLEEGIRQICLFKLSLENKLNESLWWKYVRGYSSCLAKLDSRIGEKELKCYEQVKNIVKIDHKTEQQIQLCMESSFEPGDKYEATNLLLEENKNNQDYHGVYLIPALFINESLVKEDLNDRIITSAICSRLKSTPPVCLPYQNVVHWNRHTEDTIKEFMVYLMKLLLVLAAIILLVLGVIKMSFKREMNLQMKSQIQQHVSQYMKISDERAV